MKRIPKLAMCVVLFASLQVSTPAQAAGTSMSDAQVKILENSILKAWTYAYKGMKYNYSCNQNMKSCQIKWDFDSYYKCTSGGYVHTIGSASGTINVSTNIGAGNIWLQGHMTQPIVNWTCITGWVVNGDPYLSYTFSVTGNIRSPNIRSTQSGGWLALTKKGKIPSGKQSCQNSNEFAYGMGMGHANIHVNCVPGKKLNYSQTF
jgi:hypothetical protein